MGFKPRSAWNSESCSQAGGAVSWGSPSPVMCVCPVHTHLPTQRFADAVCLLFSPQNWEHPGERDSIWFIISSPTPAIPVAWRPPVEFYWQRGWGLTQQKAGLYQRLVPRRVVSLLRGEQWQVWGLLCCAVLSRSVISGSLWPHEWGGLSGPPPGNLLKPGIKPRSPALQADSLPSEPTGKPGMGFTSRHDLLFIQQMFTVCLLCVRRYFSCWKHSRWAKQTKKSPPSGSWYSSSAGKWVLEALLPAFLVPSSFPLFPQGWGAY